MPRMKLNIEKYGYRLERTLNNENRWNAKLVCSIIDKEDRRCVSTSYAEQSDYLRLLEATTYLKCNKRLSPRIVKLYPRDKTVICDYIGEFFCDYLLNNPASISSILNSILTYFKDVNSISRTYRRYIAPPIIKTSLELSAKLSGGFEFLPRFRAVLPGLEDSEVKFNYGYGIEDPHIWNFRIVDSEGKIQALTTDFDFFSDSINYFWELGYLYATFRWFKKASFSLASQAEEILLSLTKGQSLKSRFMFWSGVLSSYCGYRDSLKNLMANGGVAKLRKQYQLIQKLDEKIASLAEELLKQPVQSKN